MSHRKWNNWPNGLHWPVQCCHEEMPEKFARWLEIFHVMDKKGDVFGRLHIGRDIDEAEDESGAESEYGKEALHFAIFLSTLNPADITLKPISRPSRRSSSHPFFGKKYIW